MKNITILSIVTASLLLVGCNDEKTKEVSDATANAVEQTKEAAHDATEATKKALNDAIEATKKATAEAAEATKKAAAEAAEVAKKAAHDAAEATKKVAEDAKVATEKAVTDAKDSLVNSAAKVAFEKCAACHGVDGKTKALGKSPKIAGEAKADLIAKINGYKAGTRDEFGMGKLMTGQVQKMDDASIDAIATYISQLEK